MQLVGDLIPSPEGRSARQAQRPHGLHGPVGGLWCDQIGAGEHGPSGSFSIDGVGLSAATSQLAVRPADLDDVDPPGSQMAGKAGAVGAAALDADAGQLAVLVAPRS